MRPADLGLAHPSIPEMHRESVRWMLPPHAATVSLSSDGYAKNGPDAPGLRQRKIKKTRTMRRAQMAHPSSFASEETSDRHGEPPQWGILVSTYGVKPYTRNAIGWGRETKSGFRDSQCNALSRFASQMNYIRREKKTFPQNRRDSYCGFQPDWRRQPNQRAAQ